MKKPYPLQNTTTLDSRNYGIDLLRILSMFSIVLLHVLGEGGVWKVVNLYSKNYYSYLIIRFFNEFAVNAYGMISGYVMCKSRPKLSRLLSLWLEVLFYSVIISGLFILFNPASIPDIRAELYNMFLPVTGSRYWYISCYFCLFFFMPVLNAGIEHLSKEDIRTTLIGLFILICVLGSFNTSRRDPFSMNYGFSTAWLCFLYLVGGVCRKYNIHTHIRIRYSVLGIIACVSLTVLFKVWMDRIRWRLPYTLDWMLMSNVSITYTLSAFFMLMLFLHIHPGKQTQTLIKLFSPAALAVYLIHVHPMIWSHFFTDQFVSLAALRWPLLIFASIIIAFLIFALCLCIDLCRIVLFKKLRIEHLCKRIEQLLLRSAQ